MLRIGTIWSVNCDNLDRCIDFLVERILQKDNIANICGTLVVISTKTHHRYLLTNEDFQKVDNLVMQPPMSFIHKLLFWEFSKQPGVSEHQNRILYLQTTKHLQSYVTEKMLLEEKDSNQTFVVLQKTIWSKKTISFVDNLLHVDHELLRSSAMSMDSSTDFLSTFLGCL